MDRDLIFKQICNVLARHDRDYDSDVIENYIDMWYENKQPLIEVLRKHPQWNEDVMAVAFDYDTCREIDRNKFYNAFYQIMATPRDCLAITRDNLYYGKKVRIITKDTFLTDPIYSYYDKDYFIPIYEPHFGQEYTILCTDHSTFTIEQGDTGFQGRLDYRFSTLYYETAKETMEYDNKYWKIDKYGCMTLVDEECKKAFTEVGIKCAVGQKMSRVLNKEFINLGLDKKDNYNYWFAELADAINPLKITRHTLLSVHPCDYLHMSFGYNWHSCHNIDNGCYMAGTLSYLLDSTSMIFYTVSADFNGTEYFNEPKINRQVYCYNKGTLLQSRLYPNYNDNSNIGNFRNVVQAIFAAAEGVPNLWTLSTNHEKVIEYATTTANATHYPDYDYEHFNPSISFLKGKEPSEIYIGSQGLCLCCGKEVDETETLYCRDHRESKYYCNNCDSSLREDDVIWIDGRAYCRDCVYFCERCEEYHRDETIEVHDYRGRTLYVCNDCLDYYTQCYECGEYFESDTMYSTESGRWICDDCYDEYYATCGECGEIFTYREMEDTDDGCYCQSCWDEISNVCDHCGVYSPGDIEMIDGERYCSDCAEKLSEEAEESEDEYSEIRTNIAV